MEITDFLSRNEIQAFEIYYQYVMDANKKVESRLIKEIAKHCNECFVCNEEAKSVFKEKYSKAKELMRAETDKILNEWFDYYILN